MSVKYPTNNKIVILEHFQCSSGYEAPNNELSIHEEWCQSNALPQGGQETEDRFIAMKSLILG